MKAHLLIYLVIGFFGLVLPWIKRLEQSQLLNAPIIAIILGMVLFSLPIGLPDPDPIQYGKEMLILTELTVIISLMGAGLKINRDFSIKAYRIPLLLVLITMLLSIGACALLGWWFGLVPASAVLLGAAFAPTDPVLSSGIQVKLEEDKEEEHPVQFSLTAEAGINDGMAFPFTWLAVWLAIYGLHTEEWLANWFFKDLLYRVVMGIIMGYASGKAIAWLYFELPKKLSINPKQLGFLAVALTLFIYGITEAVHGYGFIAVFVAALTIRHNEKQHAFHKEMHDVVAQVEHFLVGIILLLLGGYMVKYGFAGLSLKIIGFCLGFIFILRPLFAWLPLLGNKMPINDKRIIAFMGIKGIGSFFYIAFAIQQTQFVQAEFLWNTVAVLVLISAVLHRIVGFYIKKNML